MPNQHVVPNPNGGWDVKAEKSKKATKHYNNQNEAYHYAQELAKKQKTESFLHGKDGRIRARESYGNDPRHIKDSEY